VDYAVFVENSADFGEYSGKVPKWTGDFENSVAYCQKHLEEVAAAAAVKSSY